MHVTLHKHRQLSSSLHEFTFTCSEDFQFTAGQYIELSIPTIKDSRWFTIASSPDQSDITIVTRIPQDTPSTFKQHLLDLSRSEELHVSQPMGAFVLPKIMQTHVTLVAGGIGITPFLSMAHWLLHTEVARPLRVIHAVHSEDDLQFNALFEQAGIDYLPVVTAASAAWGGERGALTAEMVEGLGQPDSLYYISGPENFVQHMQQDLESLGINDQKIIVDEFQGYSSI